MSLAVCPFTKGLSWSFKCLALRSIQILASSVPRLGKPVAAGWSQDKTFGTCRIRQAHQSVSVVINQVLTQCVPGFLKQNQATCNWQLHVSCNILSYHVLTVSRQCPLCFCTRSTSLKISNGRLDGWGNYLSWLSRGWCRAELWCRLLSNREDTTVVVIFSVTRWRGELGFNFLKPAECLRNGGSINGDIPKWMV